VSAGGAESESGSGGGGACGNGGGEGGGDRWLAVVVEEDGVASAGVGAAISARAAEFKLVAGAADCAESSLESSSPSATSSSVWRY